MTRRGSTVAVIAVVLLAASLGTIVLLRRSDPQRRLDAALLMSAHRPIEGRFSGMPYVARRRATRSQDRAPDDLRLRAVALSILSSEGPGRAGTMAALVAGYAETAVRQLTASINGGAATASAWNDLAAARMTVAADKHDTARLCAALAAADRARYLDPKLAEAWFNRAIVLEALSLSDAAARAYQDYLGVDSTSPWAVEARERLRELDRLQGQASSWSDRFATARRVAAVGTSGAIADVVRAFPQEARVTAETEVLADWGAAVLAGQLSEAAAALAVSRTIASALRELSGESLLHDAVSVIDEATVVADERRLAALAAGHVGFRSARAAFGKRDIAAAAAKFDETQRAFDAVRTPMSLLTASYRASVAVDGGRRTEAAQILASVRASSPDRYRALAADLHWTRGTIAGYDGFLEVALTEYEDAHASYRRLGEEQNATEMRNRIAAVLTILGRSADAWQMRAESFASASRSGDALRLAAALYSAASDAVREEQWDVAHALMNLVADVPEGNPRIYAEALVWRGLSAERAGMSQVAAADVTEATHAVNAIPDPSLREETRNELRFVEALLGASQERDASLLTDYIQEAERSGRTLRVPQALMARARIRLKGGHSAEAESDLERAISVIEARRSAIASDALRDSFLGKSNSAYVLLADLLDRRGATERAIATLDRQRGRTLFERLDAASSTLPPPSLADVSSAIPEGTLVVTYGVFADRLVLWSFDSSGVQRAVTTTASPEQLERLVSSLTAAIADRRSAELLESARALHRLLLDPLSPSLAETSALVIIPDASLHQVPFAALLNANGRYLIESHTMTIAPSLGAYVRSLQTTIASEGTLLAVGDPDLDALRYSGLPRLAAAREEIREIAAMYENPEVLLAERATEESVTAALPAMSVAHFAVHGVLNPRDGRRSHLLLAAGGSADGALTTAEIAAMRLPRLHVVVLAGCQTAVATTGYGDVRSLAAAFVAAGARNAIATSWDLDDRVGLDLSVTLHRFLRDGMAPAEALRRTQLHMFRSGGEAAHPQAWAAVQLYGFGS